MSATSTYLPDFDEKLINHPEVVSGSGGDDSCYYSDARDGMLPDSSLVQGRLLVAAWEEGLEGAGHTDPEVTNLILVAAEQQIRSIINALVMDRKGFKLMDSKFPNQVLNDSLNFCNDNTTIYLFCTAKEKESMFD